MWLCFDSVAMTLGSLKIFSCFLNLVQRWGVVVQMLNAGIFFPQYCFCLLGGCFHGLWMEGPHVSAFCKYLKHTWTEEFLSHLWKDIRMYNLFSTVGQVLFLFLWFLQFNILQHGAALHKAWHENNEPLIYQGLRSYCVSPAFSHCKHA